MMAGNLQTNLDRTGIQDEVFDVGGLAFPAQPADPTVLEPADPPARLGRLLGLRVSMARIASSGMASIRPSPNNGVGLRCDRLTSNPPAPTDGCRLDDAMLANTAERT